MKRRAFWLTPFLPLLLFAYGLAHSAPVRLAYKWEKGRVLGYNLGVSAEVGTTLSLPSGEEVEFGTTIRQGLSISLKALRVYKDGSADVLVRVARMAWEKRTTLGEHEFGIEFRMGPEGPEYSMWTEEGEQDVPEGLREWLGWWAEFFEGLKEEGFIIKATPRGKVLKVKGFDWAGEEVRELFWGRLKRAVDFPKGPVDIGEKWKRRSLLLTIFTLLQIPAVMLEPIRGPGDPPMRPEVVQECELEGFANVKGFKCAKILLQAEVDEEFEGAKVSVSSEGVLYFAVEEGILVHERGKFEGTIETGKGPVFEINGRYRYSLATDSPTSLGRDSG